MVHSHNLLKNAKGDTSPTRFNNPRCFVSSITIILVVIIHHQEILISLFLSHGNSIKLNFSLGKLPFSFCFCYCSFFTAKSGNLKSRKLTLEPIVQRTFAKPFSLAVEGLKKYKARNVGTQISLPWPNKL